MGTMTVTVLDRQAQARGWGNGGGAPIFRAIAISDRCPSCGGPRGEVYKYNFHEDGGWYNVDRWDNPCGHVDMYDSVLAEAAALEQGSSEVDRCEHCKGKSNPYCPAHGIGASNARRDRYWRRVGGHD
jgi:hypothetical protein